MREAYSSGTQQLQRDQRGRWQSPAAAAATAAAATPAPALGRGAAKLSRRELVADGGPAPAPPRPALVELSCCHKGAAELPSPVLPGPSARAASLFFCAAQATRFRFWISRRHSWRLQRL